MSKSNDVRSREQLKYSFALNLFFRDVIRRKSSETKRGRTKTVYFLYFVRAIYGNIRKFYRKANKNITSLSTRQHEEYISFCSKTKRNTSEHINIYFNYYPRYIHNFNKLVKIIYTHPYTHPYTRDIYIYIYIK